MIYLLVWAFDFLMLGCLLRWPRHGKIFCLLAVLAMGAVAALRGAVGTDTQGYETISAVVRQAGVTGTSIEPVFGFLLHLLQLSGLGDVGVVRLIAVLNVAVLAIYTWRSTEDERYFLLSLVLPAFFYAYAMNTLRIGLASMLFLLFAQQLAQARRLRPGGLMLAVLSGLMHYSALVFPLFFLVIFRRWSRWLILGGAGLCVLAGLAVIGMSPGYFMGKLQSYDGFAAPSHLSGLSGVILVSIMMLALWASSLPADLKIRLADASLALTAVFIGVAQVSYAGLRLLDLVAFVCPVAVYCAHGLNGVRLNPRVRGLMLAFGLVSVAFVYRRFLIEPPGGPSPFLPYHVWF